jgi:formate-dependent nitrite reductase cytochrome c552 subunit
MPPLFPPWSNSLFAGALGAGALMLVATPVLAIVWARTPYATGQDDPVDQPIAFDHRHHVRDDRIDCLYCHSGATRSAYAGVPPTSTCMSCHGQVWSASERLRPVRESYFDGRPIVWQRVTTLPAFVYFDHSAHVSHGVGCVTCHGRVDLMAQVYPVAQLTMEWCLECHRQPDEKLRPLDRITDMEWAPADPKVEGQAVRAALHVDPPTECTTCHR